MLGGTWTIRTPALIRTRSFQEGLTYQRIIIFLPEAKANLNFEQYPQACALTSSIKLSTSKRPNWETWYNSWLSTLTNSATPSMAGLSLLKSEAKVKSSVWDGSIMDSPWCLKDAPCGRIQKSMDNLGRRYFEPSRMPPILPQIFCMLSSARSMSAESGE